MTGSARNMDSCMDGSGGSVGLESSTSGMVSILEGVSGKVLLPISVVNGCFGSDKRRDAQHRLIKLQSKGPRKSR